MTKRRYSLVLLLAVICWACSEKEPASSSGPEQSEPAPQEVVIAKPASYEQGKASYNKICAACHMPTGQGVPGLNPPLVGTEWVMGDKDRLIGIVLNGFNEEIEIDGDRYANEMAALDYLSDEEIANILTFVRFEFGRKASEVTIEEVATVRASGS